MEIISHASSAYTRLSNLTAGIRGAVTGTSSSLLRIPYTVAGVFRSAQEVIEEEETVAHSSGGAAASGEGAALGGGGGESTPVFGAAAPSLRSRSGAADMDVEKERSGEGLLTDSSPPPPPPRTIKLVEENHVRWCNAIVAVMGVNVLLVIVLAIMK
jgi:hypothetical protein